MTGDGATKRGWGLQPGDEIVPGRFVLRPLGGGVRFEVYLASDDTMMTTVVVKLLRPDKVGDERAQAALRREAGHLSRLAHPSIVRMFDSVLEGDRPHVVLEHLEGPTLATLVRRYGPLPVDQLLPLTLDLCAALHYLHGRGIVHLDVKPGNVVMAGAPTLVDLSAARGEGEVIPAGVGTRGFIAPELLEGGTVSPAADLWALGRTLRRAATGAGPGEAIRWPEGVPPSLGAAIEECLREDPDARPTARALAERIEPLIARLRRVPVLRHGRPRLG